MINQNFTKKKKKKIDDEDIFLKIPREPRGKKKRKTRKEKDDKRHLGTTNVEVYKNLFQESTDQRTFKSSRQAW